MKKLTLSTSINAPRERVWSTLLDDATYREWTSEFQEGSYAVTDWKEGSKALFLTPTGDGMVSRIAAHRPNQFLSIEHLGTVKNFVEDTQTGAKEGWAGAYENYSLRESEGGVTLTVEMDVMDEYRTYVEETWPKALDKLQRICEGRRGKSAV